MIKLAIVLLLSSINFLFSQSQKIGYVNLQYIYTQNEDARLAHADVEKEAKRLQVEYENKAMYLDSLMKDYQKLELMLTEEMKLEKQKELQERNIELENFQIKYFAQPNGEIYKMLEEKMEPVDLLVRAAIDKVAAENSYDYVLDISQGVVLYKLDSFDLTEMVIEKLNKISSDSKDDQ